MWSAATRLRVVMQVVLTVLLADSLLVAAFCTALIAASSWISPAGRHTHISSVVFTAPGSYYACIRMHTHALPQHRNTLSHAGPGEKREANKYSNKYSNKCSNYTDNVHVAQYRSRGFQLLCMSPELSNT